MYPARRNISIDIAKCIGIALVVLGHVSGYNDGPILTGIRSFVYQFHVPLFFFLSGMFFKPDEGWRYFLVKKIRRLYLPFVLSNLVFFAIHIVCQIIDGQTVVAVDTFKHCMKILLGIGITPLGGATWFLITLFEALIIYKFLYSLCGISGFIRAIVVVGVGIVGTTLSLPCNFDRVFVAVFFIFLGHQMQERGLYGRIVSGNKFQPVSFLAGMVCIFLLGKLNHPDMALHEYGNAGVYLVSAIVGTYTTLLLCELMKNIPISAYFAESGSKTIWILIGQFAGFKIITIVQMLCAGLPFGTIFSHPCNDVSGFWPVAYFVCGFFVPLSLSYLFGCHGSRS